MSSQPLPQPPEPRPRSVHDADLDALAIHRPSYGTPRQTGRRPWWLWSVLFVGVATVVWNGVAMWSKPAVEVVPVVRMASGRSSSLAATGYVVAQRQALIASKGTGRLEYLGVKVGDQVKEGQVIARLEHSDIDALLQQMTAKLKMAQAQLGAAQPELQEARLSYERVKSLLEKSFVTKSEHDMAGARLRRAVAAVRSAEAAVAAAEAERRAAEVQLENTNIRAPFDGIVVRKLAEVGEVVSPMTATVRSGGSVASIVDPSSVMVDAEVSESVIHRVRAGQPAEIQLDSVPGHRYRGEVVQVMPIADRAKATVLTRVRFLELDERVRAELSAKVRFDTSSTALESDPDDWGVPVTAVITRDGRKAILVVRDGVVAEVQVRVGATIGTSTQVSGALTVTDEVIVTPPDGLPGGTTVTVVRRAS